MRADVIKMRPIHSSFFSCGQDAETIIKELFVCVFENTGMVIQNKSIEDFAVNFGVGLPFGGTFSNVNIGFEIGKRGTKYFNLIEENYFNINIGLSFNDKWFVKPKYTSSTTLLLATGNTSSKTNTITTTDVTLNSKLVSTYSALVQSKSIIREVISNVGINISEEELKNNITITKTITT